MIRTTTTIRGNRVSRGDVSEQLARVAEIVRAADTDLSARGVEVSITASYQSSQPAVKDRVEAKVIVSEGWS